MGVRPHAVKENWEDNSVWEQAMLLAYEELRSYEDSGADTAERR